MSDRGARPDLLSGVLSTVLQRADLERELRGYAVWRFWDEEVGAAIAQRAQPTRFRNGILFVAVASHTWMQELQFLKESLRDKLNARLGSVDPPLIRDIYFVSGRISKHASTPQVSVSQATASGDDEPAAPALPSSGNPQFDAVLARIQRASRKLKRAAKSPGRKT
jgi:predicted nucleic acid-binding Zn ribbon protein